MTKKIIFRSLAFLMVAGLMVTGSLLIAKDKGKENCGCKKKLKPELKVCLAEVKNSKPVLAIKDATKKKEKRNEEFKACMKTYKLAVKNCRKECKEGDGGTDNTACTTACTQQQTDGIAACGQAYDIVNCGGDAACEAEFTALKNECIASVNSTATECTAACK